MGKENFEAYSAGKFEAMNSARNAWIGKREEMNTRAQQLGTPENASKQVETFTPAQLKVKKAITGLQNGPATGYNQSRYDHYWANNPLNTFYFDNSFTLEPQIWAAIDRQLGKESKQQLLAAIEAKKAQTKHTKQTANIEAKQQAITNAEQAAITQQLQAEASKIALQAPTEVIIGGLALLAIWVIRRLPDRAYKVLGTTTILTLILAACATVAPTPNQENAGTNNHPTTTEAANLPNSGTKPTTEINLEPTETTPTTDPAEIIKQALESTVANSLAADPNRNATYVQYVEALDGKTLTQKGVDFLNIIGVDGKRIVDNKYINIGINQYGILYAEHVDGTQIVFDIKDDNDNYLIVTKQEGFNRLTDSNPAAVAGKTIDDFTLTADTINGVLASLLDQDGKPVEGVNAQTRQWQAIDAAGALVGNPEAVPTATIAAQTSAAPEGLLTSDQEVIANMVKDFAAGKIEFPTDLTREQYSAFIKEMNAQYSNKPIWAAVLNKEHKEEIYYHDVASNTMKALPGSYEKNQATIDQNFYSMYVEIDQEAGTGNLQFVNPNTGELVTVPDSAGVDWTQVIDENNLYSGAIELPTDERKLTERFVVEIAEKFPEKRVKLLPAVLIDAQPVLLTCLADGRYWRFNNLEMLFIKTDRNGKPLYAIKAFVGPAPSIYLVEEGGSREDNLRGLEKEFIQNKLKAGAIYLVAINPQQVVPWEKNQRASIDKLQNVVPVSEAYHFLVGRGQKPRGANLIVIAPLLIKKK